MPKQAPCSTSLPPSVPVTVIAGPILSDTMAYLLVEADKNTLYSLAAKQCATNAHLLLR